VSPEGEVLQFLLDPTGERVAFVSSATEHQGNLFLGNLRQNYVSVYSLKDATMSQAAPGEQE